jgi:hypothetical protein
MAQTTQPPIQYRVSVWEGIAIATGAVVLVIAGLFGLSVRMISNAFDPQRAEAIAQNLLDYKIPGGSQGKFSINIGGAKMAVVTSAVSLKGFTASSESGSTPPPEVEIFVARTPVNQEASETTSTQDFNATFSFSGLSFSYQSDNGFQATSSRQENKVFCGVSVPFIIQEGQQTLIGESSSVPAIKYSARVVLDNHERLVVLTALGQNAKQNATTVFNSLRCK